MELLRETRVHTRLFQAIEETYVAVGSAPTVIHTLTTTLSAKEKEGTTTSSQSQIDACEQSFHELYNLLYAQFCNYWVASHPTSIMDFPKVYKQFKLDVRKRADLQPLNLRRNNRMS